MTGGNVTTMWEPQESQSLTSGPGVTWSLATDGQVGATDELIACETALHVTVYGANHHDMVRGHYEGQLEAATGCASWDHLWESPRSVIKPFSHDLMNTMEWKGLETPECQSEKRQADPPDPHSRYNANLVNTDLHSSDVGQESTVHPVEQKVNGWTWYSGPLAYGDHDATIWPSEVHGDRTEPGQAQSNRADHDPQEVWCKAESSDVYGTFTRATELSCGGCSVMSLEKHEEKSCVSWLDELAVVRVPWPPQMTLYAGTTSLGTLDTDQSWKNTETPVMEKLSLLVERDGSTEAVEASKDDKIAFRMERWHRIGDRLQGSDTLWSTYSHNDNVSIGRDSLALVRTSGDSLEGKCFTDRTGRKIREMSRLQGTFTLEATVWPGVVTAEEQAV